MKPNGQALAYLGDAVIELLVRKHLLDLGIFQSKKLHEQAVIFTSALGQAKSYLAIKDLLTDEEMAYFKHGRNANLTRKARNQSLQTYQQATGLEALFGQLYLNGSQERIYELFNKITTSIETT
ncbi:MAG: Mini-ribonuclease 3 [Candidatus Izemoplasmataceae bacterium]